MKRTGDYQICVSEATEFYEIAKHLEEGGTVDSLLSGQMYPIVVNGAFACELYLKALMIKNSSDDSFKEGHKLTELFRQLPSDIQNKVKIAFENRGFMKLEALLTEMDEAFIKWRYAFEGPVEGHISELLAFAGILKEQIEKL